MTAMTRSRILAAAPAIAAALALGPGCVTTRTATPGENQVEGKETKQAPADPAPSMPDEPFRAEKPAPLPVTPSYSAPVPAVKKLKNGIEVWVLESSTLPVVAVEVLIRAGVNAEPLSRAGLAGVVASMLDEGTRTRSATQLAEAIEDLAMEMSTSAGREDIRLHVNSLSETLPGALDILADVLLNPAFRAEDLDRVRRIKLTALEQKKGVPTALAADEMGRLLFGSKHPWGQPGGGTPEALRAITTGDLRKFHETWFRPNNTLIVVSGDVKADQVVALLEERLGRWKPRKLPALALPAWPDLSARTVTFVDKPNASQSQVWVAGRLVNAKDPDATALRTANFALGGLFTSRLNMNLREDKGYSYGVFSRMDLARTYGVMVALGGVIAKNTADALVEYQKELERFATGGLTEEELARSREAYIRTLPSRLETNDARASAYATVAFCELGTDYYQTLPAKIAAVTPEDVARVARHVQVEKWPVIVVGPAEENADRVRSLELGPMEVKPVPSAGGGTASGR